MIALHLAPLWRYNKIVPRQPVRLALKRRVPATSRLYSCRIAAVVSSGATKLSTETLPSMQAAHTCTHGRPRMRGRPHVHSSVCGDGA
eukprot:CAMPEP_0114512148 /NCGR_PEP_ID=MMETSP0109-20121206/14805_1 /TAXON_ID=29199 /ORGANISM="Chlorarachnion reptans, Strain CCCM449" /LENGTH=87 /DNA_ID=CAMNT_0001691781 /DNA_START=476 /DNA_END=736 /DNA_ORIENTATION=+